MVILDQTQLPMLRVEQRCTSVAMLIEAISVLAIRGAPALGVAGAMGVALAAEQAADAAADFQRSVRLDAALLVAARPTAVNLAVGVQRALAAVGDAWENPTVARLRLTAAAEQFHAAEVWCCEQIGAHGAGLFGAGARICTICNAGALATGGYGTALGVVRRLHADGLEPFVWVPETRPLLQGARLTAWELGQEGIAHAVLPDAAVASRFGLGLIDAVVVGADRIARNGDTANKLGTFGLAIMARHHGVPLYVAAPCTTIDPTTLEGSAIVIEERSRDEVAGTERVTVPADSPVVNPAFDVTPASLIDAIITEDGVHRAPYAFAV